MSERIMVWSLATANLLHPVLPHAKMQLIPLGVPQYPISVQIENTILRQNIICSVYYDAVGNKKGGYIFSKVTEPYFR